MNQLVFPCRINLSMVSLTGVPNTVERRLSGDGLTDGRLNRAHKSDSCSYVRRKFAAIVNWVTSFLCSSVVSRGRVNVPIVVIVPIVVLLL